MKKVFLLSLLYIFGIYGQAESHPNLTTQLDRVAVLTSKAGTAGLAVSIAGPRLTNGLLHGALPLVLGDTAFGSLATLAGVALKELALSGVSLYGAKVICDSEYSCSIHKNTYQETAAGSVALIATTVGTYLLLRSLNI